MADLADHAADAEQMYRDQALAKVRALVADIASTEEPRYCVDCGDLIPAARAAVVPGARRCLHCAERAERGGR